MRKPLLSLCAIFALSAIAYAGPESYSSGKEMKQAVVPAPCPEWYGDNEWNVSAWGTYAFTNNDELNNFTFNSSPSIPLVIIDLQPILGSGDRYLETDHAWGGGLDLKYFFKRYFGVGLEGYVLDAKRLEPDIVFGRDPNLIKTTEHRAVGSVLGTFTLRYPFHCSRFSPYAWAGGGAIFGGGERDLLHIPNVPPFNYFTEHTDGETKLAGQFGAGLEIRFTRHIGWLGDFSWNVVEGPKNSFGMVRSGINFAF